MARRDVDKSDIQAIAKTAFNSLNGASYLLLRVEEPGKARTWLRGLRPTSVADLDEGHVRESIQIAFTAAGLSKLGVADNILCRFAPQFVEGMAGDELRFPRWRDSDAKRDDDDANTSMDRSPSHEKPCETTRSRRLGDIGANSPARWEWGVADKEPHVLLMLFSSADRIGAFVAERTAGAESAGLSAIAALTTSDMGGFEPFGFKVGVSQPDFEWESPRTPGTKADRGYTNRLALGELLLGYRDEYGFVADRPLLEANERNATQLPEALDRADRYDLGLNGSYLVFRQLAQDVREFWRWIAMVVPGAGLTPEQLEQARIEFAEAMVGRRMDGKPLADLTAGAAIDGVADADANGFTFEEDPDGLTCPIGAHIRRANPRTGDAPSGRRGLLDNLIASLGLNGRPRDGATSTTLPWPRNTTVWPNDRAKDDAIASARFHRLPRRGREYGRLITKEEAMRPETPDPRAGLHFLCLNTNIARQFEFVQGAWLENAKFGALSGEQDPLLGNREEFPQGHATDGFTRPGAKPQCRFATGLPQFVTVRGGAYFFLPGLNALQWLLMG
jgi:deferrochelatase/peroxidase EfeB